MHGDLKEEIYMDVPPGYTNLCMMDLYYSKGWKQGPKYSFSFHLFLLVFPFSFFLYVIPMNSNNEDGAELENIENKRMVHIQDGKIGKQGYLNWNHLREELWKFT